MKKRNICVPDQTWDKLSVIARSKGIGVSELIRRVLDDWLEKENAQGSPRKSVVRLQR